MSFTSRGVLADAVTLWRAERELLVPLAGLFFVVPMLAAVLLIATLDVPATADPEKMREALMAFYWANFLPIFAINLAFDFGTFAVFNLYLQGGGRTLGEVLLLALRRFPMFFVINLIAGLLFSFGLWLVLPALFALARTWLAGPAYAAAPERGIVEAFRQGWRRSAGFSGFSLLAVGTMIFFFGLGVVIIASGILGTIAGLVGGTQAVAIVSYLTTALLGGAVWAALAVVRVAAYRLGAPKQGI